MTRLIDSLEKKGLAKRITDENDKRNNLILLTPEGKAIEEKAFLVANATMREALVNVTPQELAIGQDLLKKIFNNMQGKPNKEA